MKDIILLGIESSCDETAVAIVKNGREVLANVINSQIPIHEKFGGVVPEIASRNHVEAISEVTKEAMKQANVTWEQLDGICCTYGPGLVGALLVGVSYAKALAFSLNKPLIPVNHIAGHIAANYITYPQLEPPFLGLIISGGHTHLVNIKGYEEYEIIGKTRDDAVGEAFDKVARVIGLGYPGGPKVDKLAKEGVPDIKMPKVEVDGLDFSFSGIKTAIINMYHKNPEINKANLAASFEESVSEILVEHVRKALKQYQLEKVVLAGGVSANSYIRSKFDKLKQEEKVEVYYPEMMLCTDNAAMIASAGYYDFLAGKRAKMDLNAVPNLKLGE